MPRRGALGDAVRIEAALTPQLRAALEELRELLDLHDWRATPIGPPFALAACVLHAAHLTRAGLAPTEALNLAADQLGLERETVRSWARRWSVQSRVHSAQAHRRAGIASLVAGAANALSA